MPPQEYVSTYHTSPYTFGDRYTVTLLADPGKPASHAAIHIRGEHGSGGEVVAVGTLTNVTYPIHQDMARWTTKTEVSVPGNASAGRFTFHFLVEFLDAIEAVEPKPASPK